MYSSTRDSLMEYSIISKKPQWRRIVLLMLMFAIIIPLTLSACMNWQSGTDWRTADRSSAGIAPDPSAHPAALVQVYAARAFRWRGALAVHTWIATKREEAARYTVHQVMGWRVRYGGGSAIVSTLDAPDRHWFGNKPWVVTELHGETASAAIENIERAVRSYPYNHKYVLWPGPNSNTFVATIMRQVPELEAAMPALAIGKDYLPNGKLSAVTPSGGGYQLSVFGVIGILLGKQEGLELNLLGLTVGIDLFRPAIKLPGLGRLGY